MFLSIIVPVYNTEKYLTECLDSLLEQDIDTDDYEIICINDGSTDNSLDILQKYVNEYSNVVVINQQNKGVSAARNRGMESAKGDYFWFVDSDDLVQKNILNRLKNIIIIENCDCLSARLYFFNDELNCTHKSGHENGD